MRSDRYYVIYIYVVVFLGWQAVYSVSAGVSNETHAPVWTWHIVD